MSVFDLLFIFAFLATVIMGVIAIGAFVRRRTNLGLATLRRLGIGWAVYAVIVAAVSGLVPQRVFSIGDPWCFDEWCLTVKGVSARPEGGMTVYQIALRLHSQARRRAQRANGAWIYLIDVTGRRFEPVPDPTNLPLDVLLQPDESIDTTRTFRIPSGAQRLGLVTGHGGPYCGPMSLLIIGNAGCVFNKPTMVGLK